MPGFVEPLLYVLIVAGLFGIGWVLVAQFRRTSNRGYLFLVLGVVLWGPIRAGYEALKDGWVDAFSASPPGWITVGELLLTTDLLFLLLRIGVVLAGFVLIARSSTDLTEHVTA